MQAKLIVVDGKTNRKVISLELPAVIGRGRQADLTVAHPMISRRHCRLYEVDGLMMVCDLESLNGTAVEGLRVVEGPLRPDDRFTIGPLTFRVQYDYDGDLDSIPAPKPHDRGTAAPTTELDSEVSATRTADEIERIDEFGDFGEFEVVDEEPRPTPSVPPEEPASDDEYLGF